MLKALSIENFKAFGEQQGAQLAPITLIYGPNSGGKSSIIQSLLLQKQSMESKLNGQIKRKFLIPVGPYVDLGQSKSMHHRHNIEKPISFGIKFSDIGLSTASSSAIHLEDQFTALVSFKGFDALGRRPLPELVRARLGIEDGSSEGFNVYLQRAAQSAAPLSSEEEELFSGERLYHDNFFRFKNIEGVQQLLHFYRRRRMGPSFMGDEEVISLPQELLLDTRVSFRQGLAAGPSTFLPSRIRMLSPEKLEREYLRSTSDRPLFILERFLLSVARAYERVFEGLTYLGPLRSRPKRVYEFSRQFTNTVGVSGEYSIDALADSLIPNDVYAVSDYVNQWMNVFEIPYVIEMAEAGDEVLGDIAKLMLIDTRTGVKVAATDVGFGIGQILPIIIEGILAGKRMGRLDPTRVICVEQPELHLHPKLQAHIGDFFIDTYKNNRCQWIAETHSEALLLRIQRRIREGRIDHKAVSVVFVNPVGQSGSEILNLRMNEYGDFIDEWPGGFFEDGFSEIFS
ncbi:hypothetical protein CDEN61S_04158 [Castellaniella denitrificans]